MFTIDTETARIAPGCIHPPLTCLTVAHDMGAPRIFGVHEARQAFVTLASCGQPIVAHNAAFDMGVLVTEFPDLLDLVFGLYEADLIHCTEVRAKLADICTGDYRRFYKGPDGKLVKIRYGLKDLVLRFWGQEIGGKGTGDDDEEAIQLNYGPLRGVPVESWPREFVEYATTDIEWPRMLYSIQPTFPDQGRQCRAAFWTGMMSANGIHVDRARVEAFGRKVFGEFDALQAKMLPWGWVRPDGSRDIKRVTAYVDGLNLPNHPRTKPSAKHPNGQTSLLAEHLRDSGNPYLEIYADASELRNCISNRLPDLAKGVRDGVINTRFDSLKETGRTGSSNPPLQNLPTDPGVRECFVPPEGEAFIVTDYAGFELATWAQVCWSMLGRSRMREALNDGLDPHCEIASMIMHCTYEEAIARKDGDGYKPRQAGKIINFGRPGGGGVAALRAYAKSNYGVRMTHEEMKALIEFHGRAWPEVRPYFDRMSALLERGYIEQLFVGRVRGKPSFPEGCNSMFQGLAADAAKHAGWLLLRACHDKRSPLYGCKMRLFVHDEFVLSVPLDRVHEACEEQERLMIAGAKLFIPDVRVKVESVATLNYSKKAKRLAENGRLIPWQAP